MNPAVQVRRSRPAEAAALVPALAQLLIDCVAAGASVSFMHPLGRDRAEAFWRGVTDGAARGGNRRAGSRYEMTMTRWAVISRASIARPPRRCQRETAGQSVVVPMALTVRLH